MATCTVIILCEICNSYTTPQGICSNNSTLIRRMNKACYFQSWNSIGGIVTRLWAGQQETTIQHFARTRDFSLFQNIQTSSEAHPASYSSGTRSSLQGVWQPQHEANHSPPSCAEVKNAWSCTSAPQICLQDTKTDNFIFLLFLQYTLLCQFQPSLPSLLLNREQINHQTQHYVKTSILFPLL